MIYEAKVEALHSNGKKKMLEANFNLTKVSNNRMNVI